MTIMGMVCRPKLIILSHYLYCDQLGVCTPGYCKHGNCIVDTKGEAVCECWEGWVGDKCEIGKF